MATTTKTAVGPDKLAVMALERGLELKSLKTSKAMSQETMAFTATIYLNGEIVGEARNSGNGEQTMISNFYDGRSDSFKGDREAIEELANELPDLKSQFEGLGDLEINAPQLIDLLADFQNFLSDIKRRINKKNAAVWRSPDQAFGAFNVLPNGADFDREQLETKYDIDILYNELI